MSENKQAAAQQGLKRVLVTLGVAALGCLVWLILGSIFSGIGVPMWVSGVIALLIFGPAAAGCFLLWNEMYPIYQSGDEKRVMPLSRWKKTIYKLTKGVLSVPAMLKNLGLTVWNAVKGAVCAVGRECREIVTTFVHGDWKTKCSYVVMGFGNLARGQILRGLLFLLFEVVFIGYMILAGGYWLSMLPSLGKVGPTEAYDEIFDTYVTTYNDNSFKILLYGVLTIFFIIAFIYTWRVNIRQNQIAEKILKSGKKLRSGKDDLRSLVDDQFHKTLLALPLTGILVFTVLPIVFMILVAFTNYDGTHDGY